MNIPAASRMRTCNRTTQATLGAIVCAVVAGTFGVARADTPAGTPDAAGAAGAGASPLEEIVVTAERRGELLSNVPVAVSALTTAQLQNLNIRTTADLAGMVPAFQATDSAQSGAPVYTLRGVGFNTANITSTAPVGLYVGEVAYAYPLMASGELFDLQRVEVLRGPQGTLYGRNTTGGLIDYVPAAPTRTPEAEMSIEGGNYGAAVFSGHVSGPLSDTLTGRLAFQSQNRFDGWQHSVTREDTLGTLYRQSLRAILDWTPNSRVNLEGSFNFWVRTGDTQAEQAFLSIGKPAPAVAASIIATPTSNSQADWTPASDQPFSAANGIVRPRDADSDYFYGLALRATYHLTDRIDLVSLSSAQRLDFDQFLDSAGVQTEELGVGNTGFVDSFSEEVRAVGSMDPADWSVGAYYAYDKTLEVIQGFAGENPTIEFLKSVAQVVPSAYTQAQIVDSYRTFGSSGRDKTTVAAMFGNLDYKFLPTLKLNLGVRYTRDDTSYTGAQFDQNGQELPIVNTVYPILLGHPIPALTANGSQTLNATDTGFTVADEKQDVNNTAWRAALSWTPTDATLFYVSVSQGFKSGVFPTLNASAIGQLAPVKEERLRDYEAGAKLSVLDRRLQIDFGAFYYDYTDHQVFGQIPDLIFGTLPAVVNVPKSEIFGADWNVRWAITNGLHANLSGSSLDTRVNRYHGSDAFGVFHDYTGASLPYAPKFSGFASLTQDFPLADGLGLQAMVDGRYQSVSNTYIGSDPQFQIKAYGLFDVSLALYNRDTDRWRLSAYVDNLADRYYWSSAQISHDTIVRLTGMPRTYGLRATLKF